MPDPSALPRSSGVLLHPTCLPGPYGIGDLGPEAYRWIQTLTAARQSWWQILPLGPTGAGDSFVGAMMGYLATSRGSIEGNFRRAMVYGSVVASFCCEGFGVTRTTRVTRREIESRAKTLAAWTQF